MAKYKNLWRKEEWFTFVEKVKDRDGRVCLTCLRSESEVVLQVHHEVYIEGKKPWEYALSDCVTLCKGCHAREHGLIEPSTGWTLLSVDDLGGVYGSCELSSCGSEIRYENLTYHPKWGELVVGSTCIEYLTQDDKELSKGILKLYVEISKFVHSPKWENARTRNGKKYLSAKYKHHEIRIYGSSPTCAYQLCIKEKGIRRLSFREIRKIKDKSLDEAKEIGFIVLRGTIAKTDSERELLKKLYKAVIKR